MLALLSAQGCSSEAPSEDEGEVRSVESAVQFASQPVNVIFDSEVANGNPVSAGATPLPPSAYAVGPEQHSSKLDDVITPARSKIHPILEAAVTNAELGGNLAAKTEVVVTFTEDMNIPRFPEPKVLEPRNSPANTAARNTAAQMVSDLQNARAVNQNPKKSALVANHKAKVLEDFWLINGMVVEIPIGKVRSLAARNDIQSIEPRQTDIAPPANNSVDARALMVTDPYFNLNLTGGWFGLLDTGVRVSHTLLNHYAFLRDCVTGGSDCNTGSINTDDNCWNHGTSSMSELTANANLGNANRGVTGVYVDSFKVYSCAGLDRAAAVRGFQAAIPALDRVIVAEIQDTSDQNGAIAAAADAAYNAGAVVVAANGNFGPNASTVRSPGNARKALGVGAADVTTQALQAYSGRGPTLDGRYKPDILGPTNVNAASTASTTALQLFTGTSAATPNAAAATGLIRNFIRGSNFELDPGQINAFMIMTSRNQFFDNNSGAGLVRLPTNGHSWWGSVSVGTGSIVNVPIGISSTSSTVVDVALWWPESATQAHNDVDLELINPNNVIVSSSLSGPSIYEKARASSGFISGTWQVRVRSYNVSSTQTVYYAVNAQ